MEMELVLRFENGQAIPWVRRKDYGLSAVAGPHAVELHTDLPLLGRNMLDLRNDLGLLAEEYDTVAGRLLGNFPQALSHIGLINTAHDLVSVGGPAQQRAQKTAPSKPHKVSS